MTRQDFSEDYTRVRRRGLAIKDQGWIREFLWEAPYGTLATVHQGRPFQHINTFVYDPEQNVIYFHTAARGRTRSNVEADGRVCFAVAKMGRLYPGETASEFSVEYASVVVFGRAGIVEDPAEARRALLLLMEKYFPQVRPGKDYRPITERELKITSVFKIKIEGWSGKAKRKPEHQTGAFRFEDRFKRGN